MFFHGVGPDDKRIRRYCLKNRIANVCFTGAYQPSDKEKLYSKADLIYAAYGNNTISTRCLVANKLYDAAWYKIPILVSKGTEMANQAGLLGYELDFSHKDLANDLFKWYNEQLDWEKFEEKCDYFIKKVIEENNIFEERVVSYLRG